MKKKKVKIKKKPKFTFALDEWNDSSEIKEKAKSYLNLMRAKEYIKTKSFELGIDLNDLYSEDVINLIVNAHKAGFESYEEATSYNPFKY
jgi:hypothetical protein